MQNSKISKISHQINYIKSMLSQKYEDSQTKIQNFIPKQKFHPPKSPWWDIASESGTLSQYLRTSQYTQILFPNTNQEPITTDYKQTSRPVPNKPKRKFKFFSTVQITNCLPDIRVYCSLTTPEPPEVTSTWSGIILSHKISHKFT